MLCFSYGNYFEKPTAEEVGQVIARELRNVGFNIQWDGSAESKVGIKGLKWDKHYSPSEEN